MVGIIVAASLGNGGQFLPIPMLPTLLGKGMMG